MAKLIEAYDTRTGAKLPQRVPESWTRIFKHISATPRERSSTPVITDVPEADGPDDVPTQIPAARGRRTTKKES